MLVLTGLSDTARGLEAVAAGAQDYLVKGFFDATQLRRALQYASHRKRVEQELLKRAMQDHLTGLPTRALMLDRLYMALNSASRSGSLPWVCNATTAPTTSASKRVPECCWR